jgi:hypothetical protein
MLKYAYSLRISFGLLMNQCDEEKRISAMSHLFDTTFMPFWKKQIFLNFRNFIFLIRTFAWIEKNINFLPIKN